MKIKSAASAAMNAITAKVIDVRNVNIPPAFQECGNALPQPRSETQSESMPEAERDVDLVAQQSAARIFPGVTDIAIDEITRTPFIGQAGRNLGRDPGVAECVAVAQFKHVPRPLRIELQITGKIQSVIDRVGSATRSEPG